MNQKSYSNRSVEKSVADTHGCELSVAPRSEFPPFRTLKLPPSFYHCFHCFSRINNNNIATHPVLALVRITGVGFDEISTFFDPRKAQKSRLPLLSSFSLSRGRCRKDGSRRVGASVRRYDIPILSLFLPFPIDGTSPKQPKSHPESANQISYPTFLCFGDVPGIPSYLAVCACSLTISVWCDFRSLHVDLFSA